MAISDRINEMYTHVGDVYDTITNVDLPTNKNIQNIPSTMRSSYLEIMNNGIDKIWNNWEKVEGTGETLTLNSTEKAPMKINLKGNTSQETTTGKNLMPSDAIAGNTYNGIAVTLVNGKLHFQGRASAEYFASSNITLPTHLLTTKQYYFKAISNRPSPTRFKILGYNSSDVLKINIPQDSYFTPEEEIVKYKIVFEYMTTGTSYNFDAQFQIEEGGSFTSYEPYTNGASPNPDYPQDVDVVSGNNSIKVEGKNLCDTNIFKNRLINCYAVNDNGSITQSATDTNFWRISYMPNSLVLNSGTYTISVNNRNGSKLQVYNLTTNSNIVEASVDSYTFTLNNDNQVINAKLYGASSYPFTFTMQIEKGSTATPYTPYQSQTYPINIGNIELCKIGDYQDSIKKSTGKNLCNTTFELGGIDTTTGQNGSGTDRVRTKNYVKVKPNTTYTLSGAQGSMVVCFYNSSKAYLSYAVAGSQATSGTFTTPNDTSYIRWYIIQTNTNINEMLNEGTTALPYEPYGTSWYLNKQIGKVVLNGSESGWLERGNTSENYIKFRNANALPYDSKGDLLLISDYFVTNIGANNASYSGNAICGNSGNYAKWLHISIDNTIVNSVETFKTWLSTHNTTVYYALQTPTYTEITDSTLLSQLETLNGAKSYTTQTNISQENNDLPFILDATALKQLN